MKKYLVLLILVGCVNSGNTDLFIKAEENCPKFCKNDKMVWTGYLKAYPNNIACVCE